MATPTLARLPGFADFTLARTCVRCKESRPSLPKRPFPLISGNGRGFPLPHGASSRSPLDTRGSKRLLGLLPAPRAAGAQPVTTAAEVEKDFSRLKEFLEDCKEVGLVRVIVNTGMGVLESITKLDKLFYHSLPGKGEYANVILPDENVDFHLLLDKVAAVRMVRGTSMRGNFPTYTMRFVDSNGAHGASLFVMWRPGTQGEYEAGQVDAFEQLVQKYGEQFVL